MKNRKIIKSSVHRRMPMLLLVQAWGERLPVASDRMDVILTECTTNLRDGS